VKELRINKLSMGLFALLALSAPAAFAEDVDVSAFEWIDVIETKDGSVLRGVVFEQEPGVKYKLTTNDGNIHVINAADVVKLTKARNKFYRGTAAAPQQHGGGYAANNAGGGGSGDAQLGAQYNRGGSGLPAPMAPTGVRATFALAAMFPSGDIEGVDTSFAPTIRIGYEKLFGNFGLSAGGQLRFTYWLLPGDSGDAMWTLETHGFVRGALHLGRVAPYLGGSLGIDTNYIYIDRYAASQTDLGVGLNLDLGLTIAATPQLSFDLGGDYHPGTDTLAGVGSVEYFALRAGAQLAW
jgi:hypothetical protein